MKFKTLFALCLAVSFILSSCSDSQTAANDTLKSIPQNVSMVTAIDADAILEKADFESVKQMEFYQELIQETKRYNSTLGAVLTNPASSGIDLSQNIYVAHNLDVDNPEDVFVGIIASVKDKAALETLINSDSRLKKSSQDGFDVAMNGSQSVAWNAEKVLLGMTNSYADPISKIQKFFNTASENSIANDSNLKKAFSGNHDITSWASSNALANSAQLKNALTMASIDPNAAKDNFIHSYVDFNKGAIESHSDMYLQDALMEDVNLFFKDKLTTDFSKYVPSNANSAMTVALDLEGIQTVLQKKGVLMMANFGLKEYGLTVDDISSSLGGDILVYATPGMKDTPYGTFATTILDKEKLGKILTLGSDYNVLEKAGDNVYSIKNTSMLTRGPDAQLVILDDMLLVSGDPGIISKVIEGGFSGGDQIDKSKIKTLRSNIFSGFSDFSKLIKTRDGKEMDLNFDQMNFSTNRKNADFNMDFKDKSVNSLKQLFESINEIYLADKKGAI